MGRLQAAPLPAARAGANQEPLALDGGKPVRATKLAANYPGPLYYGDEEKAELIDVIERRAPFRWYGIGPKGGEPGKCIRLVLLHKSHFSSFT